MATLDDYMLMHGRVSRSALARFAGVDRDAIDEAADKLGYGPRLTLEEAEDVIHTLDAEEEPEEPEDGDDEEE